MNHIRSLFILRDLHTLVEKPVTRDQKKIQQMWPEKGQKRSVEIKHGARWALQAPCRLMGHDFCPYMQHEGKHQGKDRYCLSLSTIISQKQWVEADC